MNKEKLKRLAVGVGLPAALLTVGLLLFIFQPDIGCPVYQLTGLYCPGCGTARALTALAYGKLGEAAGYNPLLIVLLPFGAYLALGEYISYVFGKKIPMPNFKVSHIIIFVCLIALYTLLRNLPFYPFTLLAPICPPLTVH